MKLGKLLLTAVGVTVLLGALVASASARNFELSSQTKTILWTRWNFRGGFGTVDCEVKISGSFHTRTFAKVMNSLIGYVTEGTVLRCAQGGATLNQASLPWHLRFNAFGGTLPIITGEILRWSGAEWLIVEPFGIRCTVRRETSSVTSTYSVSSGVITRAELSGESPCSGINGTVSGSTTNVTNGAGARLTTSLI
jgi:hypothetical protein